MENGRFFFFSENNKKYIIKFYTDNDVITGFCVCVPMNDHWKSSEWDLELSAT